MEEKSVLQKYLDSDYTLLQEFGKLAGGTLKHCECISSICEKVAKELGLNPLVMKVAGLYHDIGKIYYPSMYSENQGDENPHEKLSPELSYLYITQHVANSVYILVQNNFPLNIIKIISEHHGTRKLNIVSSKTDECKYKGQTPSSLEASILMIVDIIEAKSKALYLNNKLDNIPEIINNTIDELMEEDQLDFNVKLLKPIKKVLIKEISDTYHKRVKYEKNEKE